MARRHITFACEGDLLAGTLDEGSATAGLLLITGGNEIRSGAFSGQARLAARIAEQGFSVFRFDRRGIGDSEGENVEFRASAPDIAAALIAFRKAAPHMKRVVGFGNCDAASALMLAQGTGLDALILSNPWTFDNIEEEGSDAPPEVVRDHYRKRLADPAAIKRLLTGQVSLRKLAGSLISALRPAAPPSSLVQDITDGLSAYSGEVRFLIAERDRTAQAFLSHWNKSDPRIHKCADASHAYVEPHASDWLDQQIMEMLRAG